MRSFFLNTVSISLFVIFSLTGSYAQPTSDSLHKIFLAPTFSLLEDYSGDWGGYSHTFTFTRKDTCVDIIWQDPDFPDGEAPRELKISYPLSEIKKIESMFNSCIEQINSSKDISTEHSKYIFKSKDLSCIMDDRSTMKCVEILKEWKQELFRKGIEQEKIRKKK